MIVCLRLGGHRDGLEGKAAVSLKPDGPAVRPYLLPFDGGLDHRRPLSAGLTSGPVERGLVVFYTHQK
jgi:hypothetical protein